MRSRAAGTIISKAWLPLARVLAVSFHEHHPDIPFFVLLADEVDGYFDPGDEPFRLISMDDVPIPDPDQFRFQHPQQPLSFASTPHFLDHLLDMGFSQALFFKQESLVTGDQGPTFDWLDEHSIVITPHMLAPVDGPGAAEREMNILQSGIFNIGVLGVSDSVQARSFLAWWKDRTYAHCRIDLDEGMHYEQRWIDLVPAYFGDAHILRDPGANVGHWNLPEREVRVRGKEFEVLPVMAARFSGVRGPTRSREPCARAFMAADSHTARWPRTPARHAVRPTGD